MYGFLLVTCNFELGIGILYDFQILKDIVIVSTVMILIEAMHQQRHPREASRILRDLQHKFQEISLPDLGYLLKNIAKSLRSGCLFAALLMGRRKSHQSSIISKSRMSLVESILSKSQGGMRKWQAPIHGLEWKLLHVDPTRNKRSQAWGRIW